MTTPKIDTATASSGASETVTLPRVASQAMLRAFYECPPEELQLAWNALVYIGEREARALLASAAPKGWKLVPEAPTREMLNEIRLLPDFSDAALTARYGAMLDAAPIQQAAPAPVVPADSRDQALGLYVAQAEAIRALLDKHAPDTHGNLQTRLAQAFTRGSRIDADKLHREIVGWVRDEDGTTGEPAFLRGPARPPRDYRGNYRPVIYETDARHAAAELVSDALGGGDTDGGKS